MMSEDLRARIDQFEALVGEEKPQRGYWSRAWNEVRGIGAAFRETVFLTRDERQELWQRFQELVTRLRERSEESKAQAAERQRGWERRASASEHLRDELRSKAQSARPAGELERAVANMILLPLKILQGLIGRIAGVDSYELAEIRDELQSCSAQLKEAWERFGAEKEVLLPRDRQEAYAELRKAQELLDEAWRRWKERKAAERGERPRARAEGRERFHERVRQNIASLEEKREKAESARDRQREHLSDLRDKYESAWNESFKERCEEWIEQGEAKLASIEEHLERLDGWLAEQRAKLS